VSRSTRRIWLWPLLAMLLAGLALWVVNPQRTRPDIAQPRDTRAGAIVAPGQSVTQTFESARDGLFAIDVAYLSTTSSGQTAQLEATLARLDSAAQPVARVGLSAQPSGEGRRLSLQFAPLQDSAGVRYRLTIACPDTCDIQLLSSEGDSLSPGSLAEHGVQVDSDLAFNTYYRESFRDLALSFLPTLAHWLVPILALAAALGAPGLPGALLWAGRTPRDPAVLVAMTLATGLTFWPLLLLWCTTLGLALTPRLVWVVTLALGAAILPIIRRRRSKTLPRLLTTWGMEHTVLLVVSLLAVLARLIQARDLIVPAWVDSVHHTALTSLIAERGMVPTDGAPYLQVSGLHYHYGFHAVAAVLTEFTGLAPSDAVLLLGQVLSGLAGWPIYGLVAALCAPGRARPTFAIRWAGVVAASIPAFATYMPAYYVSWGRYTQLAGLVLLPVVLALSIQVLEHAKDPRSRMVLPFLIAGLSLTHYRVLFYFTLFWLLYTIGLAAAGSRSSSDRSPLWLARTGLDMAARTLAVLFPWVVHLVRTALMPFVSLYGTWAAPAGVDTALPLTLLSVGNTEWVLFAAAVGLLLCLVTRRWRLVFPALWVALCLLTSDPGLLGMQGSWFVNGTSAAISYWLPAGLYIGLGIGYVLRASIRRSGRIGRRRLRGAETLLTVTLLAGAVSALWSQAEILNRRTVLVFPSDLPAIAWARENLPEDSLVLVNTEPWQGDISMGSDAGWWLTQTAGVRVTYPSVLFTQGDAEYRAGVVRLAQRVQNADDLCAPEIIDVLRGAGVSHVFVGSRGGPLQPERLCVTHYVELFRSGPTRVYRFLPEGP